MRVYGCPHARVTRSYRGGSQHSGRRSRSSAGARGITPRSSGAGSELVRLASDVVLSAGRLILQPSNRRPSRSRSCSWWSTTRWRRASSPAWPTQAAISPAFPSSNIQWWEVARLHRGVAIRAAAQHRVPASYSWRDHVQEGGLMSYGADTVDIYRPSAGYVDRILKGVKPADFACAGTGQVRTRNQRSDCEGARPQCAPALLTTADEVID